MTLPAPDADLRHAFIEAMSRAATGVSVVTTASDGGRYGQTVSAYASVSADPPMLLVCINRKSATCTAITASGVFAVNLLRADQRHIAESFAGRPRSGLSYDFGIAAWEIGVTGAPVLAAAAATFDCRVEQSVAAGTHQIFIARVVTSRTGSGSPLTYARRHYGEYVPFPGPRGDDNRGEGFDDEPVDGNIEELWG